MTVWKPKRALERRYAAAIALLIRGLLGMLKHIRSPAGIIDALRRYARSPTFKSETQRVALSMVTHLFSDGHKTWRQAARSGGRGQLVYTSLRRELQDPVVGTVYRNLVDRNAELICTVPDYVAQILTRRMAKAYEEGTRTDDMVDEILKQAPQLTRNHARLIARTEISKASTALTEARCEESGVQWYVWRTSEDERVRSSHRRMEGVIVSWSNPPDPEALAHEPRSRGGPYHAGNIYNCRCYPEPLLDFTDVTWPHKVYVHGRVQTLTLARFKRLVGGEL